MQKLSECILNEAQAIQEDLRAWRRELHQHPETGFDLPYTKDFVRQKLISFGCAPADCGEGITALIGRPGGKTLLLRADMDALPVQEEADVPYRSQTPGKMHACGHDLHTSMLLGAARLLKQHEHELNGQVKLMFQPAEEIMGGAMNMIEHGVLDEPRVDAALMMHVVTGTTLPMGKVMIPAAGTGSYSFTVFTITVKGRGGHGAMPNLAVDPINVLAHIYLALQEIHAREIVPGEALVLTVGSFHGGNAPNVIPDTAEMSGTIRAFRSKTSEFAKERVTAIAQSVAAAFRAEAEVTFSLSCPPLIADAGLSADARTYLTELLGDGAIPPIAKRGTGGASEDFAFVSLKVPAIALFMGVGEPDKGYVFSQHNPKALFDDGWLCRGAACYAYFAMRWLEEHG